MRRKSILSQLVLFTLLGAAVSGTVHAAEQASIDEINPVLTANTFAGIQDVNAQGNVLVDNGHIHIKYTGRHEDKTPIEPSENTYVNDGTYYGIHLAQAPAGGDANFYLGNSNKININNLGNAIQLKNPLNAYGVALENRAVLAHADGKSFFNVQVLGSKNVTGVDLTSGGTFKVNGNFYIYAKNQAPKGTQGTTYGLHIDGTDDAKLEATANGQIKEVHILAKGVEDSSEITEVVKGIFLENNADLSIPNSTGIKVQAMGGTKENIGIDAKGSTIVFGGSGKTEVRIQSNASEKNIGIQADNSTMNLLAGTVIFGRMPGSKQGLVLSNASTANVKELLKVDFKGEGHGDGVLIQDTSTYNQDGGEMNVTILTGTPNAEAFSGEVNGKDTSYGIKKERAAQLNFTNTPNIKVRIASQMKHIVGLDLEDANIEVKDLAVDAGFSTDRRPAMSKESTSAIKAKDSTILVHNEKSVVIRAGSQMSAIGIQGESAHIDIDEDAKVLAKTTSESAISSVGIQADNGYIRLRGETNDITAESNTENANSMIVGVNALRGGIVELKNATVTAKATAKEARTPNIMALQANAEDSGIYSYGMANITGDIVASQKGRIEIADVINVDGNGTPEGEKKGARRIQGNILAKDAGSTIRLELNTPDSVLEGSSKVDGGKFNLTLTDGAKWQVAPQWDNTDPQNPAPVASVVSELITSKDSFVDLTKDERIALVVEDFKPKDPANAGVFKMHIAPKGEEKNTLEIKKATDDSVFTVLIPEENASYLAEHKAISNDTLDLGDSIKTPDNIHNFKIAEGNLLGDTVIHVEKTPDAARSTNTWKITNVSQMKSALNVSLTNTLAAVYGMSLPRVELSTLHERLGEIRNYESQAGAWARVTHGKLSGKKDSYADRYTSVQVGYDTKATLLDSTRLTGLSFAMRNNDISAGAVTGSAKNYTLQGYVSYVDAESQYLDVVATLGRMHTSYHYAGRKQDAGTFNNTMLGLSVEAGKKFTYTKDRFLTPMAQLSYHHIGSADFMTDLGILAQQSSIDSLVGTLGVKAGIHNGHGMHYVKAGLSHEFAGGYHASLSHIAKKDYQEYRTKDTWFEIGVGGTVNLSADRGTYFYYDVEKSFGSTYLKQWQVNVGLRYQFK